MFKKILLCGVFAGIAGATTGGIIKAFGSKKTVIANLEAAQAIAQAEIAQNGKMSEESKKRLEDAQRAAERYIKAKR